jgi:hypothetical protein
MGGYLSCDMKEDIRTDIFIRNCFAFMLLVELTCLVIVLIKA